VQGWAGQGLRVVIGCDEGREIYQRSEILRRDDMAKLVDTLTKKTPFVGE
jgi:hypothetical protein